MSGEVEAPTSPAVAEKEETHAHNWRWSMERFFEHPEDWNFKLMKRVAQETLNEADGAKLEVALNLIRRCDDGGFDICAGPDEVVEMVVDPEKGPETFTAPDVRHWFEVMCRQGIARIMEKPPYRTSFYMKSWPLHLKDIKWRFCERGSIFNANYKGGQDIIITGNKKSGKSYLVANYIAADDMQIGLHLVGNFLMKNDPGNDDNGVPWYRYADTLSETFIGICDLGILDLYISRLYDEIQASQKRVRATSSEYQAQKDLISWTRKLHTKTAYVTQRPGDVPSELQEFADVVVDKPFVSRPDLADITISGHTEYYYGVKGPKERHAELRELGIPVLDYDSDWISIFIVDINAPQLYEYIRKNINVKPGSKEPVSKQQFRLIKEYLEGARDQIDVTDETRALHYLDLRERLGITYAELSRRVGWPEQRLHRWAKRFDQQKVAAPA